MRFASVLNAKLHHAGTAGLLGLVACASLSACPDPAGRLDDWRDRSEPFRKAPAAGECSGVEDISGTYLLGVAVIVNPSAPLRFKLDLTVDVEGGTIDATLQPYAVPPNNGTTTPGTLIGEVYSASSIIDPTGGTFALDFGALVVPVEGNALLPVPAGANMTLVGCTSAGTSSCGLVQGEITDPAPIPLAGSTWAIIPLADPLTADIAVGCP